MISTCASSTPNGADETATAVRAAGKEAWTVNADLGDRDAVLRMADAAEKVVKAAKG